MIPYIAYLEIEMISGEKSCSKQGTTNAVPQSAFAATPKNSGSTDSLDLFFSNFNGIFG